MRAGQVEQIVLPKRLVRVQFKGGKERVNIFPNDQEVLRTAGYNVPLDVRNSQEAAMTGLLVNGLLAVMMLGLLVLLFRRSANVAKSPGLWP